MGKIFVKIGEAAKILGCSVVALRKWEANGELLPTRKTKGGTRYYDYQALLSRTLTSPQNTYSLYDNRKNTHEKEKIIIGKTALDILNAGDVVYVSHGTTTYQCALQVPQEMKLTIITEGLDIVSALKHNHNKQVIMVGGLVNYSMNHLQGFSNKDFLKSLNIGKFIIGAAGISETGGVSFYEQSDVEYFQSILSEHQKLYICVDSSKVERSATYKFCDLSRVDGIFTDSGVTTSFLETCKKLNVHCAVAPNV